MVLLNISLPKSNNDDFILILQNNVPWNGIGKWYYSNGDYFDGLWKDGKRWDGIGKITFSSQYIYEGYWKNGWMMETWKIEKIDK